MVGPRLHPTADVSADVQFGEGVVVGPFAIIEGDVHIGDRCIIDGHAVVRSGVRMGADNRLHPHAVVGGLPQDVSFDASTCSGVELGEGNVIREGVTINRATQAGSSTRIGSRCYFMNNSHVAHDCTVADECVFASGATIGGFVSVAEKAFLSGGVMVHQFCRIGAIAIISGLTGIRKDIIPYTVAAGDPARHYRLNIVGLRRAGVRGPRFRALSEAFLRLRTRAGLEHLPSTPEVDHLRSWLTAQSKRGITGFARKAG